MGHRRKERKERKQLSVAGGRGGGGGGGGVRGRRVSERGRRAELNSGWAGEAARLNERAGDPL